MYYTERLKWVRDCKNITQKEIADFLNIKQQQYARYEKGVNAMPITYLKDICKYLDVSADYIIGLTDEMNPYSKEKWDVLFSFFYKAFISLLVLLILFSIFTLSTTNIIIIALTVNEPP